MGLRVEWTEAGTTSWPLTGGHRRVGDGVDVGLVNRFLTHLSVRSFATATRRAYAYDLLVFGRFCAERGLSLAVLTPTDVFDYLDWQQRTWVSRPVWIERGQWCRCGIIGARRRRR
jgi:integrase/recombinase XerC